MLFNKCEQSNRMRIEDRNKDNYKNYSEQFDHKCTYIIHKCIYKCILTMTQCNLCAAWSRKTPRCTALSGGGAGGCLVFIVLLL